MANKIKIKKRRDNWKAYLIIGIIILLIAAIYFTFFFYYSCSDMACFQSHQKKCAKTKFIDEEEEDTTWKYTIQGKQGDECEITVEILSIKEGSVDKQKLEGEEMNCYLPLGSIVRPESDLARCHGELKEDMQNLIIQQLHSYIIENVEEIDEELEQLF